MPCSYIATAAQQCEFKDLERCPRRETWRGLERSDLVMAATGLLFIIQRNRSGYALNCSHTKFTCEKNFTFRITWSLLGSLCSIWAVIEFIMTSACCSWPFVMLHGQNSKSDKSFINKCHEISSDIANYRKSLHLQKQDSIDRLCVWLNLSWLSPLAITTLYFHTLQSLSLLIWIFWMFFFLIHNKNYVQKNI